MIIELPLNTIIQYSTEYNNFLPEIPPNLSFQMEGGKLKPLGKLGYPQLYIDYDLLHQQVYAKDNQWSQLPSFCYSRLDYLPIPVLIEDQRLEVNTDWFVFPLLLSQSEVQENYNTVFEALEKEHIHWSLVCPSIVGPIQSLIGQLIHFFGWKSLLHRDYRYDDWDPEQCFYGDLEKIQANKPLIDLLKDEEEITLQDFKDNGQTLLDLASNYQLWDLADWLWGKGVRWSPSYLQTGSLLVAVSRGCSPLPGERYLNTSPYSCMAVTQTRNNQWLKRWLDRYGQQDAYPENIPIVFNGHNIEKSPSLSCDVEHGDILLWLEHTPLLSLDDETIQIWIEFWNEKGINFHDLVLPFQIQTETYSEIYPFKDYLSKVLDFKEEAIESFLSLQDRLILTHSTTDLDTNLQNIRRL